MNEIENSCLNKINNLKLDNINFGYNSIIFNKNNFKSINVAKIYISIIESLIKKKNFYNSFEIIKQLDFESIIITK